MKIDVRQITQYDNSPKLPTEDQLKENYIMEFPFLNKDEIKVYTYENNTYIYSDIPSTPIFIDRHRENCFSTASKFQVEFTTKDKGGHYAGYCKIQVEPLAAINSVVINQTFEDGAKYKQSLTKYSINKNWKDGLQLLYSQYISQSILNFCDNYNVVESAFNITDLVHHPIDTSPLKYSYWVQAYLKKAFIENKFTKIRKSA